MTKVQKSHIGMGRRVRDVRINPAYTSTLNSVLAIAGGWDQLAGHITLIQQADDSRADAAVGAGEVKKTARTQAIATGIIVDGMLTALAANTSNADLMAHVDHEISHLRDMDDDDLRTHLAYLNTTVAVPATLALLISNYGMSEGLRLLLVNRTATFVTVITLPQNKADQEGVYVELIKQQFVQMRALLDLVLDKLMRQFKESHPALYLAYHEAREIIDPVYGDGGEPEGGGTGGGTTPPPTP